MAYVSDYSAGQPLPAADVNSIKNRPVYSVTAGETINGATLPVAVFIEDSDGEFYACDSDDADRLRFDGLAVTNGTDGASFFVQFTGIVPGFTGLTQGAKYYVQSDKTLGTTVTKIHVGVAVSSTAIKIEHTRVATGVIATASGTTTQNVDETFKIGFKPKLIIITYHIQGHDQVTETSKYFQQFGILRYQEGAVQGVTQITRKTDSASDDASMTATAVSLSSGSYPSEGSQGANQGIVTTFSINSVNNEGFVFRSAFTAGTGNTKTGRVRASWEAYG